MLSSSRVALAVGALAAAVAVGCAEATASRSTGGQLAQCPPGSLPGVSAGGTVICLSARARHRVWTTLARVRDAGIGGSQAYATTAGRRALTVATVKKIAHEAALANWALPPALKLPAGAVVLATGGSGAATELDADVDCNTVEPRHGLFTLHWRPAQEPGTEQRVQVTIFRDGFAQGLYEASGPLAPDRSSFEWHRVHGRAIHLWRVLTRHESGWTASETARVTGPVCIYDAPARLRK